MRTQLLFRTAALVFTVAALVTGLIPWEITAIRVTSWAHTLGFGLPTDWALLLSTYGQFAPQVLVNPGVAKATLSLGVGGVFLGHWAILLRRRLQAELAPAILGLSLNYFYIAYIIINYVWLWIFSLFFHGDLL